MSEYSSPPWLYFDFGNEKHLPKLGGGNIRIVDPPYSKGRFAFFYKTSGNWKPLYVDLEKKITIQKNQLLSLHFMASTSGRCYLKLWNEQQVIEEGWVNHYEFHTTANKWVSLVYSLYHLAGKQIDKIEINPCVDNLKPANVYLKSIWISSLFAFNDLPTPVIEAEKYILTIGEKIILKGENSYSEKGEINSWKWSDGVSVISTSRNILLSFQKPGWHHLSLEVDDLSDNRAQLSKRIWVRDDKYLVSPVWSEQEVFFCDEKIEHNFLIDLPYNNPFDRDEIQVDAIVMGPAGEQLTLSCFYKYPARYETIGVWLSDEEAAHWCLRWQAQYPGEYKLQIVVRFNEATFYNEPSTHWLKPGCAKGIIRQNLQNPQLFEHQNGAAFFPLGINAAWDTFENYKLLLSNLSRSGANFIRYWLAAFTNQQLEWHRGIGYYDQLAAAKLDYLLEECQRNAVYLQLCIFHHGMFSTSTDSNWADNPYNSKNGGPLNNPEAFFYQEKSKVLYRKLLHYLVARYGAYTNLLAWELFNEVQWTGHHPMQSNQWKVAVLSWQDEMAHFIKQIDHFRHPVTSSANKQQLTQLAEASRLDILQYHTYPRSGLYDRILELDIYFLKKLKNVDKAIFCGEYGYYQDGDVSKAEEQRLVWLSLFIQVPHFIWRWQGHYRYSGSSLFEGPSLFLGELTLHEEGEIQPWSFGWSALGACQAVGFKTQAGNYYGLIWNDSFWRKKRKVKIYLNDVEGSNFEVYFQNIPNNQVVRYTHQISTKRPYLRANFEKGLAFRLIKSQIS